MKRLTHASKVNILFAGIIVFMLISVFLVNAISVELNSRFRLQVDLTRGTVFEISDVTREFISELYRPVEIFVLAEPGDFSGDPNLVQAQHILDEYPRFSDMITLEYIDFVANPLFAASFPEFSLSHGDIVIRSGENADHIISLNLFQMGQLPDGSLTILGSRAEEAITSSILSVVSDDVTRVALLTGNGTSDGGIFIPLLSHNNYLVESISIATDSFYDFDILLLLSPTIDLSEDIVRRLDSFLHNGGLFGKILIYTADPGQGDLPNLSAFLREWGISFHEGIIFETNPENTYQFQPFFPTAQYVMERYRDLLRDSSMPFLMPRSRPMEQLFVARDGFFVETLLAFSETAGVQPPGAGVDFTANDAALWGPFPAMVSSSFNVTDQDGELLQSRIIASASTGILDQLALANTSLTNTEYLLNLFSDIAPGERTVNIAPVSLAGFTLGITTAQASRLGFVLIGALPALILLTGISMWLVRRNK